MGNDSVRETRLLDAALSRIAALLPTTWHLATETDVQLNGMRLDAIAAVVGPSGTDVRFAVEAKASAWLSSRVLLSTLRDVGRRSELPVLFVSDYIGPTLREQLVAEGFSYADATGWVRVAVDDPLLLVTGQGAQKAPRGRASSAVTRLNGIAAGRTIRALASVRLPIGVRELAAVANVSPGSVTKLLTTLVAEGIVVRNDRGKVVEVRLRDLVRRWVQDYSFGRSNPAAAHFIAPRGLQRTLDRIDERFRVALTGSAAVRVLLPEGTTPVVPMAILALYTTDPRELARNIGLIDADATSANVVVAEPQDGGILPRDGVGVAPSSLVVADLLTLPGRSDAEAEQLMDALAMTNPGWKDIDESRS